MKLFYRKWLILFLIGLITVLQGCQEIAKSEESTKLYYSTGELKLELSIKDTFLHGLSTKYYKNGNINTQKEFYKDIPINHHYFYSEKGELLQYRFFDLRGHLRYQLFSDTITKFYAQEGKSLYIQGNFNENYYEGDSVSLIPIVANPFKSSYNIIILTKDRRLKKSYDFTSQNSPLFLYEIREGSNPIKIIGEVKGIDGSVFKRDTVDLMLIGEK